jgi:hypothetical protein
MNKLLIIVTFLVVSVIGYSAVITVDDDGPADFSTIQAAIDAAEPNDVVVVADGVYTGVGNRDIVIFLKSISVKSANGPTNCIIDCEGASSSGFELYCNDCSLEGFTITGAGYTAIHTGENPMIKNCILTQNLSDGIMVRTGTTNLHNCTFFGNLGQNTKTIILHRAGGPVEVNLKNSISWGNAGDDFGYICSKSGCFPANTTAEFSILQSDWYDASDWMGEATIELIDCMSIDPNFADPDNGDFHLKSQGGRWDPAMESWVVDTVTSPSIDAGDPSDPIGHEPFPSGGIVNMGAYGGTTEASKSYFGAPPCETVFVSQRWLEDYNQ